MTVKSQIEVDVDDAAFQAFKAKFDAFGAALKAMPQTWQATASAAKPAATAFDAAAAALTIQAASAVALNKEMTQLARASGTAAGHWHNMRLSTEGVAANIAEMTRSLAGFGAELRKLLIGGALGAAGAASAGFWAMDRIGMSVMDKRRRAQGLGTSIGGVASFETAFGRLGNTDALLSGALTAKTDVTSTERRSLNNLGITNAQIDKLSSDELAALEISKIKEKSNSIRDDRTFYPQMAALGLNLDHETLQRIRQTSGEEIAGLQKQFVADKPRMNIPEEAARKWTDFAQEVSRVSTTLGSKFETRLSELAPSLSKLSEAFGKAADLFIKDDLGPWIDKFSDGLNYLATSAGSDETKAAVSGFFGDIKTAAETMAGVVGKLAAVGRWLGIAAPVSAVPAGGAIDFTSGTQPGSGRGGETPLTGARGGHRGGHGVGGADRGGTGSGLSRQNTPKAIDAMNYLMEHGYSREGAASAVGQILTEDPAFALASAPGGGDAGSAHGLFQWRNDRYAGLKRYLAETGKPDSVHSELDYFMSGRDPGDRGLAEKLKRATSTEEGNRLGYRYEGYRGGIQARRKRDADKMLQVNPPSTAGTVKTAKPHVTMRTAPGSDVFAEGFANVYGAA